MILPKWSTFILQHPQNEALENAQQQIIDAFDQANSNAERMANLAAIQTSPSTIILTLNPFDNSITPSFFHQSLGLTFGNTGPAKCIALTGFQPPAVPIYFNLEKLQSKSTDSVPLPSILSFMSTHDRPIDDLKAITITEDNKHHVRHAILLPPYLAQSILANNQSYDPWHILHLVIKAIALKRPDDTEAEDWTIATPYLSILHTLWSFCHPETIPNLPTMHAVASDRQATEWAKDIHSSNLQDHTSDAHNLDSTAALERLTDTLQRNNERLAAAPEEDSDDEEHNDKAMKKAWRKIDPSLQRGVLFASTTDGVTIPTLPSARLLQLIKMKSGTTAQRTFKNWHIGMELIVQPGMATNITKCLLTSSPDQFSIDTFSPFFVPPIRAGFNHMSNQELNSIEYACKSFNLTADDIKRMTDTKPYVPTSCDVLKQQIRNFSAVVDDVFGPTSILALDVRAAFDHCANNELHYMNLFQQHKYFGVWLLDRLHFKVQSILHRCFQATNIEDIEFQLFTIKDELRNISTLNFVAIAPKWYLDEEEKQLRLLQKRQQQANHQANHHTQQTGGRNFNTPNGRSRSNPYHQDTGKRVRVDNQDQDSVVALTQGERYTRIVHRTNLVECRDAAPKLNGDYICNNWHIRGHCVDTCHRAHTHVTLNPELKGKYRTYVAKLRQLAKQYDDQRKQQKPLGPSQSDSGSGSTPSTGKPKEKETTHEGK
jgi:hypothetical protein